MIIYLNFYLKSDNNTSMDHFIATVDYHVCIKFVKKMHSFNKEE